MTSSKANQALKQIGSLLCLSTILAIAPAVPPETFILPVLAQTPSDTATPDCPTERQQSEENRFNAALAQAEQAIVAGQVDHGSELLISLLRQIRSMPESSTKVNLLERLVGSLGENVAYTSPLEQLVKATASQQLQRTEAVLVEAIAVTRTLSSGYSVSKARTLTVLARDYAQLGKRDQSRQILAEVRPTIDAIQDAELQTLALLGLAEAFVEASQPDAAASILERSLPLAEAIRNPDPYRKAAALERIANLHLRLGQLDRALQVARRIQIPDYQPSVIPAIINQYSETGSIDRALEVLQTVQQADQKATALATIAGRLTAQQPQRAAQLFADAVSTARLAQNSDATRAAVAARYVKAGGQVATADETVQAIADPAIQAPALTEIALSYAKAGQGDRAAVRLKQAVQVWKKVPERHRNDIRQQLVDHTTQSGRYDYAVQIIQATQPDAKTDFDRVNALAEIAKRAIAAERYDAALQIMKQFPPNFASWREPLQTELARAWVRNGEIDRALAIVQQPGSSPKFRASTLAAIAAQTAQSGQPARSTPLFKQAIQLANQMSDARTKIETLGRIAQAYLSAGQTEPAISLVNQAIKTAQTIQDTVERSYVLQTLAEEFLSVNQYGAAIQVAEAIPEDSQRLAKLGNAVEKALNAGDFTAIRAVINRERNPILKSRWSLALIDRHIQLGNRTQATGMLSQTLQMARTIPGDESRTIAVRGGEDPLIVDDPEDRGSFLTTIGLRYAQIGQISQAQQVAQTLKNPRSRQQLLQQITCYREP